MKKKVLAMLLTAAMTVGLIAGCGSGSKDSKEESPSETVEITWLHHFQEEGIQAWVEDIVSKFQEDNPDIKVTVEAVTQDVYDQTLKTKIASDDAPIIFDLNSYSYYKEYSDAGHLYDLSELEGLSNLPEAMLPVAQIDGKQWGVPVDQNAYTVFYNKDIFDEYNLEIPTTMSEMISVCETLQQNGIQPIAAPFAEQWCLQCYYEVFACQMFDDYEWWQKKMNLTSNFADDETFKETVEVMCKLKAYWGDDPFGTNWDTAQSMFANGEAAMILNGTWTIDGVKTKNPDSNIRIFAFPTSENPDDAIMQIRPGSGFCLYNSKDEAKLEAGKKLINYILSKESGESFAQNASKMSAIKGVDLSFSEAFEDVMAYDEEHVWNSSPAILFFPEYEQLFYETLLNYTMENEMDVDALANSLDRDFAAIDK